jgi:hypothetical protein
MIAETLIVVLLGPFTYFGAKWGFRVLAAVVLAKAAGGMKDKTIDKIKGAAGLGEKV